MSGWYGAEVDPDKGFFRWIGPGRVAAIDLPVVLCQNQWIRIHVIHQIRPGALGACRIFINSEPVVASIERLEEVTVISARVPTDLAGVDGALVTIELGEAPRLAPCNNDERSLGIAVSWIEFEDGDTGPAIHSALISVVIPSVSDWQNVRTSVETFISQANASGAEIVIANGEQEPTWPNEIREACRWLWLPGSDIFELRAAGISAATGSFVAITEDHCLPPPDWCANIIEVYSNHPGCIAIGGSVVNGSTTNLIDRANFAVTFSEYLHETLTACVPSIANLALRRDCVPVHFPTGWLEFEFLPALAKVPGLIRICGQIRTVHIQSLGFWRTLANHFHNARASGGLTLHHPATGNGRLAIREGFRLARRKPQGFDLERSQHDRWLLRLASKSLILLHAAGMAVGLWFGKGRSAHRLG